MPFYHWCPAPEHDEYTADLGAGRQPLQLAGVGDERNWTQPRPCTALRPGLFLHPTCIHMETFLGHSSGMIQELMMEYIGRQRW